LFFFKFNYKLIDKKLNKKKKNLITIKNFSIKLMLLYFLNIKKILKINLFDLKLFNNISALKLL